MPVAPLERGFGHIAEWDFRNRLMLREMAFQDIIAAAAAVIVIVIVIVIIAIAIAIAIISIIEVVEVTASCVN